MGESLVAIRVIDYRLQPNSFWKRGKAEKILGFVIDISSAEFHAADGIG